MKRVITVEREFGSGGGPIAELVAGKLGWRLMDKELVKAIAEAAQIDPNLAERYDERADPWLHRVSKRALWRGFFEGVPAVTDADFFDAEAMALLGCRVIAEQAEKGNVVIVGRGAQCVLHTRPEVFHVFVYGSRARKIARARTFITDPKIDVEGLMDATDRDRAECIRSHSGQDWRNPCLYDLMINSGIGLDAAAEAVVAAVRAAGRE